MDFSEWEAGEWDCCECGVNWGVGGMMLGIGRTVRLIGKGGKYDSTLSPYRVEFMFPHSDGFDSSIRNVVSSVVFIPMV